MQISNNYIALEKFIEEEKEGFKEVKVQDSSTFKGKVAVIPEAPIFMGNKRVTIGDIVLFAKNSPDTHEVEHDNKTLKLVAVRDILAVI